MPLSKRLLPGLVLLLSATGFAQEAETTTIPVQELPQSSAELPQELEAKQLEKVEVTGSRIKRAQSETSQPVAVLTKKDIERTGLTTVGDILQSLPDAGSALGQRFNNNAGTSAGAVNVDLHNLGSNRVLVLVNGHRWVNGLDTLSSSSVDLSTIPVAAIERIEILKDGASAIYGSDAIAGVVNIITTKKFVSSTLQSQIGGFARGDGNTQSHSIALGKTFEDTALFLNASFQRQKPVFARDRTISAIPLFGTGLTRGSGIIPQGHYIYVFDPSASTPAGRALGADGSKCSALDAAVAQGQLDASGGLNDMLNQNGGPRLMLPNSPTGNGAVTLCNLVLNPGADGTDPTGADFHAFDVNTDPYNYTVRNYLKTPFTQSSVFGQVNQTITESLGFSLQLLYNRRQSTLQNAETPLLFGDLVGIPPYKDVYLDRMAAVNPLGQHVGLGDPGSGLIGAGAGLRRLVELGPRIFNQTVNTYFASGQFTGSLDLAALPISYEAGYSYGTSQYSNVNQGLVNMERVGRALGPADGCTAPCVPLNLFGGPGSLTPAMLDYIRYSGSDSVTSSITDLYANFSMEAGTLGFLPEALGVAFGLEKRHSKLNFTPDALAAAGISSNNSSSPTAGTVDATEAFVELQIPLLRALPLADSLDLSTAVRYSNFKRSGKTTTGKLGLSYRPIKQLLLRGTYSEAFRAPDVGDLFLGRSTSFSIITDPCAGDTYANDPNVKANCDADGVDQQSVSADQAQISDVFGGNPNLKPETAKNIGLGMVFSPDAIEGLDLSFDYYDIRLKQAIGIPGGQFILDTCYKTPRNGGARPPLCDAITRGDPLDPTGTTATQGAVVNVLDIKQNNAGINTAGFDLTAGYRLPIAREFGRIKLNFDSNYLLRYDQLTPLGGGAIQTDRFAGKLPFFSDTPFPRVKFNASLVWAKGDYSASFATRYVGSVVEQCDDGREPSLVSLGLCSDPKHIDPKTGLVAPENRLRPAIYNDLQVGYKLKSYKSELTFGINNIFNQEPPVSRTGASSNSFAATLYEVPGIQPYARLKLDF